MQVFTLSAFISIFFFWGNGLIAQSTPIDTHSHDKTPLDFVENKGQWQAGFQYQTRFDGSNTLFIEEHGFTFLLTHPEDLFQVHEANRLGTMDSEGVTLRHHAYKVNFLNAQKVSGKGIGKRKAYYNYIKGNNPNKWVSEVGLFGKVVQKEIYEGVQLETYSKNGHLKYDFIVAPYADPNQIQLQYSGVDKMYLREGNLILENSFQTIIEGQPVVWQVINDEKHLVKCEYQLDNETITYHFPEGYDPNFELIIDPTIIASTLSGTTISENFGHSATFDNAGNIYTAGLSFGIGYPTTTGSFQVTFGGGTSLRPEDIAISKYNPDGTDLIYATYIGGTGNERPHSIIADFNQQIYVYGSSESNDYPVTNNAYQTTHGGNNDIVISILNPTGTGLVGSSYFGGSMDDGVNRSTLNNNDVSTDDRYRGEIMIDGQNNVYVVSNSLSDDFPVTNNAYDTQKNTVGSFFGSPAQDAVIIKANSDLSVAFWITFLGGDNAEIGTGIRVADDNSVYVTGTTGGTNFPTTPNAFQENWIGGNEKAFVARISSNGQQLIASTFFGSDNGNEHSYFMDIDEGDQVHIYGQTTGTIPVTDNTYFFNQGSPQFLAAFNEDLTEKVYSTVIGLGSSFFDNYDFVPVAFMVDKCNGIYFSGYYTSSGLPVTGDAFNTNGDNFYLGVLTPNAEDLLFGTYYGDANHVDGGTSRFDKGGIVYQAVCSCEGTGILNTLPNAWATNQAERCDVGVFKIDFEIETITATGIAQPSSSGCAPYTVDFNYTGVNATEWEWTIDGEIVSTIPNHVYTFDEAGAYDVELIVRNPDACNIADTFALQIDVLNGESNVLDTTICTNDNLFLDATTANASYSWQDGNTGATYIVNEPGIYWVDIDIGGCTRRDSFLVDNLSELQIDLGPDTSFCDVDALILDAFAPEATAYQWVSGSTDSEQMVTTTGTYSVIVTDQNGCITNDAINLVFSTTPNFSLAADTILCDGDDLTALNPLIDFVANWQDGSSENSFNISAPGTYWLELNNEGCINRDSIIVDFYPPILPNAEGTDILCANDCNGEVIANATGGSGNGYSYQWETGDDKAEVFDLCPGNYSVTVTDANGCTETDEAIVGAPPILVFTVTTQDVECPFDGDGTIEITTTQGGTPPYLYSIANQAFTAVNGLAFLDGGNYSIIVQDANGCEVFDTVTIQEPQGFNIEAGENEFIKLGEEVTLDAIIAPLFGQNISWTPNENIICPECPDPTVMPSETTEYLLTVTDNESGCFLADSLIVFVEKVKEVFIPNAFSPNGSGTNDYFGIFAGPSVRSIESFKIFDRWGEMVFTNPSITPNVPTEGWDGRFRGEVMDAGVFTYFTDVIFWDGERKRYTGSVTLLR